jgi:two-component system response regulator
MTDSWLNRVDILLVEDNIEDAEMILRVLKKFFPTNQIHHLRDGEEALNYLYNERLENFPKMILLDLKMPKVDGLEVIRKMKSDEKRKIVPIVALTSSMEDRDVIESYQLGVNAYIVKPVDFEKFNTVIQQIGLFWATLNQHPR